MRERGRRRGGARSTEGRQRLAYEIARIMWEYSIEDFRLAKEKAIRQLGLKHADLPDNREIARELEAYSAIFASGEVASQRSRLFGAADRLMKHLDDFSPKMVGIDEGAVITPHSRLRLHIFCEHPEVFDLYLQEMGIDYSLEDRRFRFAVDDYDYRPAYGFDFEGMETEVVVFPSANRSRVPLSPVDGRPIRRLSLKDVQQALS